MEIDTDIEFVISDIHKAINHVIFHDELPCYEINDAKDLLPSDHLNGLFGAFYSEAGYEQYMINYDYLKELSSFEWLFHVMHHEMVHAYCNLKGILDVNHDKGDCYHTLAFKEQIEAHKGVCRYVNDTLGYNETYLTSEALAQVLEEYYM